MEGAEFRRTQLARDAPGVNALSPQDPKMHSKRAGWTLISKRTVADNTLEDG